mmetsp:Transcript_6728/g.17124  ORF Transcript_6728/g.17124 Transcript_6728/m.17124 type:complete len:311 (+) Transcript_6728:1028-1960(+)
MGAGAILAATLLLLLLEHFAHLHARRRDCVQDATHVARTPNQLNLFVVCLIPLPLLRGAVVLCPEEECLGVPQCPPADLVQAEDLHRTQRARIHKLQTVQANLAQEVLLFAEASRARDPEPWGCPRGRLRRGWAIARMRGRSRGRGRGRAVVGDVHHDAVAAMASGMLRGRGVVVLVHVAHAPMPMPMPMRLGRGVQGMAGGWGGARLSMRCIGNLLLLLLLLLLLHGLPPPRVVVVRVQVRHDGVDENEHQDAPGCDAMRCAYATARYDAMRYGTARYGTLRCVAFSLFSSRRPPAALRLQSGARHRVS